MTVTVREKGKTLEDGGGLVMNVDSWLGPQIPAMKEARRVRSEVLEAAAGARCDGHVGRTDGHGHRDVSRRSSRRPSGLQKESPKLQGTPLATTTTVEGVKSKEEVGRQAQRRSRRNPIGGLGGMLARKMAKKDDTANAARATIFTAEHEVQEVQTSVAAADLDIPAGFKQK